MASLELFKVFMASPSDLPDERKIFHQVIEEVNKILAHAINIHLEAVGWEDTLIGSGRPQSIINEDLKQCDIIVFNLWKRWGSPTPRYSSGFEEEFQLADTLNMQSGRPEVFIYFRGDIADIKGDDEEQIEKVKCFRTRITTEKKYLARLYHNTDEWQRLLREHLCLWLNQHANSFIESKHNNIPFKRIQPEELTTQSQQRPENYFDYWHLVLTPDSTPDLIKEIYNPGNCGSSINKITISPDSVNIWAIIRDGARNGLSKGGAQTILLQSTNMGYSWSDMAYNMLAKSQSSVQNGTHIWDIAIAPDDPNVIAVVCADIVKSPLIQEIWLSEDKGKSWINTKWPPEDTIPGRDLVSNIDISAGYRKHTIVIGTRDGTGLGCNNIQINKLDSDKGWASSGNLLAKSKLTYITGDVMSAKLSPNFSSDSGIAIIYSDGRPSHSGTWLATGEYDTKNNLLRWERSNNHIKLHHAKRKRGDSPRCDEIITAQLELPPDYYHLDRNSKRFYISIDAIDSTAKRVPHRGVFRVLNNKLETLMDTTDPELINNEKRTRRISSIAYAPGKLLVGEVMGFSDSSTVHTWFMNVSSDKRQRCWWPSLKPTSGAAIHEKNTGNERRHGYGNANVRWSPDATLAFVTTGAASLGKCVIPNINQYKAIMTDDFWPAGYTRVVPCDESAFAISRNNGETWNQTSLINTDITKITDFACGTDNTTVYITTNNIDTGYSSVHSIWRTTINPNVAAPVPAIPPIGTRWERVFHFRNMGDNKTNNPSIIRTIWSCTDKRDGEVAGWALPNTQEIYWTPDFGDYWAPINVAHEIVDFVFENSTKAHVLFKDGYVQTIPYTGIAWATHLPIINSRLVDGHCITACADGVFIGASEGSSAFALSFSLDSGKTWNVIPRGASILGNIHIVVDPDFRHNHYLYVVDDSRNGMCHRIQIDLFEDWNNSDMECPRGRRFYGAVMAFTGKPEPALYIAYTADTVNKGTGILRCLLPRSSVSGHFKWDIFDQFANSKDSYNHFCLEPSALKAAGCCTLDTNTSLYAIDNNYYAGNNNYANRIFNLSTVGQKGMLWQFMDITGKGRKMQ